MISRTAKLVSSGLLLLGASAALAQEPPEESEGESSPPQDWTIQVIELAYADAGEVAELLSQVLPPGVTVVPYYATNSLIIAGDPALIGTREDPGVAATLLAEARADERR